MLKHNLWIYLIIILCICMYVLHSDFLNFLYIACISVDSEILKKIFSLCDKAAWKHLLRRFTDSEHVWMFLNFFSFFFHIYYGSVQCIFSLSFLLLCVRDRIILIVETKCRLDAHVNVSEQERLSTCIWDLENFVSQDACTSSFMSGRIFF